LPLALAVMAARVVMDPSAGLAGVVAGLRQVTAPLDAWQTVDAPTCARCSPGPTGS
jgi:hypothetical protein